MNTAFLICRENHAIAEFQAQVRFTQAIDPISFGDVSDAVAKVAQQLDLPARVAAPTFAFEIGQVGGAKFSPPAVNSLNLGYQRFASNGEIDERITLDPSGITYVTRQYGGWDDTKRVLARTITPIAQHFAKQSIPLATILLQYANEFSSREPGFIPVQPLFRENARWVAPIFADLDDLWHSHVGMFLPGDGCKHLVNVNVDVVFATTLERPVEFTQAKLLVLAARQFAVSGGRPFVLSLTETESELLAHFEAAHDLEKSVFSETLSDEYLKVVNAI